MPSFTKKAIIDSFLKLASKKPFDKITVRDIVDDCGINRTTFYYYYQDIYAILEELIEEFFKPVAAAPEDIAGWAEAFERFSEFGKNHKKAVKNTYLSLGYDEAERYVYAACGRYLREFVRSCAPGTGAGEKEIAFVEVFFRKAMFGTIAEWIKHDFKGDAEDICRKINKGLRSSVVSALTICAEIKREDYGGNAGEN